MGNLLEPLPVTTFYPRFSYAELTIMRWNNFDKAFLIPSASVSSLFQNVFTDMSALISQLQCEYTHIQLNCQLSIALCTACDVTVYFRITIIKPRPKLFHRAKTTCSSKCKMGPHARRRQIQNKKKQFRSGLDLY